MPKQHLGQESDAWCPRLFQQDTRDTTHIPAGHAYLDISLQYEISYLYFVALCAIDLDSQMQPMVPWRLPCWV